MKRPHSQEDLRILSTMRALFFIRAVPRAGHPGQRKRSFSFWCSCPIESVHIQSPSVQVLPRQLPHPPPGTPDAVVHRLPVCLHVWVGGPAEYGKTLGLFSLSARFAYSNSKLTFVIFRSWQSWWGFRSPFPRYAQNLRFWLSGST